MNKLLIEVTGKRIDYFIRRLLDNKINVINMDKLSSDKIVVLISLNEYKKLKKIKTIYKIKIIKSYGLIKLKEVLLKFRIVILCFILSFIFLICLSNTIFEVNIVHDNLEIVDIVKGELEEYGIKVHKLKKSRKTIENIKNNILEKYKDRLEWMEIEEVGTKYIVRFEERIIPLNNKDNRLRSIIAKKSGVIYRINSSSGVIEKLKGEYVHKGDVIINGEIKLYDEVKDRVHAEGDVYAEVWYTVKLKYPFIYKENRLSNNSKNVLTLNFLNRKIDVFGKSYTKYKEEEIVRFQSNFLPIYLKLSKQNEIIEIENIYTQDEIIDVIVERGKKELSKKFKSGEFIKDYKILNTNYYDDYVELEVFYSVIEKITDYLYLE